MATRGAARACRAASMFDRPPPSTMTSGSRMLMTLRERARQPILVARRAPRSRSARRPRPRADDLRARRERRRRCARVIARRAPGPDRNGLDAAAPAAVARRPGRSSSRGARQRIVAPFAGDRVRAGRARGRRPRRRRRRRCRGSRRTPPARPPPRRRSPPTARSSWRRWRTAPADRARRSRSSRERPAVQPGGVGVLDEPRRRRDRARDADADGALSPASRSTSRDQPDDRGERLRRSRRAASAMRRRSVRAPSSSSAIAFDLRAAEVDADAHAPII